MSDSSQTPSNNPPNATDLAVTRTELAQQRTDKAEERTEYAIERTKLAIERTELARERTRAAQERTMMAWTRTALALISFGFGIDRLFQYLDQTKSSTEIDLITEERILGLSLMSLGLFALGAAVIGHWQTLKNIEKPDFKYVPRWSESLSVATILLFVGLAAFIPLVIGGINLSDVFTFNSKVIQSLAALSVFVVMLTTGIKTSFRDILSLWQQRQLLIKALFSALVLFPVGAALIAGFLLDIPLRTGIGLALLAAAPGAPLLTQRATIAGGNIPIALSFQVTLSALAIITTPITLLIITLIFSRVEENAAFLVIAKQVATVQFLPLGIGLLIRQLAGDALEDVSHLFATIVNTLFLVLIIFLLGISITVVPEVDQQGLIAIILIVAFGLTCGHLLGGPDLETRSSIATGTIARNVGLALFLAAANDVGKAIPTIIAYMIVGGLVALPYNVWIKAKMKKAQLETENTVTAS
jgi:BASS family bile acid:Na+ symporter